MPTGRQAPVGVIVDLDEAAHPVPPIQGRGEHRLLDDGGGV